MPRNASGSYVLPIGNPVQTNTVITTAWANPTLADVASELGSSLDRSGRGGMLAPFKATDGTISNPGITFSGESSTGWWRPGRGILALSILGAEVARASPDGFSFSGNVNFSGASVFTNNPTIDSPYLGSGLTPTSRALLFRTFNSLGSPVAQTGMGAVWTRISDTDFASDLLFFTSADNNLVERMRLTANGSVGINCIPGAVFRVQAPGFSDVGFEWQRISAISGKIDSYDRTNLAYTELIYDALDFVWQLSGNNVMQLASLAGGAPQLNLRWDAGNGPVLMLENRSVNGANHVYGSLIFSPYRDIADPVYGAVIWSEGYSGAGHTNDLVFGTSQNNTANTFPPERVRITYMGDVGVGTSAPQAAVHVQRANAANVMIQGIGGAASAALQVVADTTDGGSAQISLYNDFSGLAAMYALGAGSVGTIGHNDWGLYSYFTNSNAIWLTSAGCIGLNCNPVGVPFRIQAAGFNDVGFEWVRNSASIGKLNSYNRFSSLYTSLQIDALDITLLTSGVGHFAVPNNPALPPTHIINGVAYNSTSDIGGTVGTIPIGAVFCGTCSPGGLFAGMNSWSTVTLNASNVIALNGFGSNININSGTYRLIGLITGNVGMWHRIS